jgi:CheY-like chemotaxis protein
MVAVTGFGDEQVRERCKQAGFDHLLVKPADPQVVLDVLKAHESRLRRPATETEPTDKADGHLP